MNLGGNGMSRHPLHISSRRFILPKAFYIVRIRCGRVFHNTFQIDRVVVCVRVVNRSQIDFGIPSILSAPTSEKR